MPVRFRRTLSRVAAERNQPLLQRLRPRHHQRHTPRAVRASDQDIPAGSHAAGRPCHGTNRPSAAASDGGMATGARQCDRNRCCRRSACFRSSIFGQRTHTHPDRPPGLLFDILQPETPHKIDLHAIDLVQVWDWKLSPRTASPGRRQRCPPASSR